MKGIADRTRYALASLLLVATVLGSDAAAQGAGDTVARPPTSPDSASPTRGSQGAATSGASAAGRAAITGIIRSRDRHPVAGARVVATAVSDHLPVAEIPTTTDSAGRFTFDSLQPGRYAVRVEYSERRSMVEQYAVDSTLAVSITLPLDPRAARGSWWEIGVTALVLLAYWCFIVLARWHNIASALHATIRYRLIALRARLTTEVEEDEQNRDKLARLRQDVDDLEKRVEAVPGRWSRAAEVLWWSRGHENAQFVAIHEIERQLVAFLSPPEQVVPYLRWAEAELTVIGTPVALRMAEHIKTSLAKPEPVDAKEEVARKALLGRSVSIIYNDRDNGFSRFMEWQNKASWLIVTALLGIGFLVVAAGHAPLFLAGAAGGFLSRLMRALRRDQVPLDYGASWTTLFLSPLFGALAGWFGIAIITLLARPDLGLLGDAFAPIRWYDPYAPYTLAVAFLLGFSERIFDAVVGAVERNVARPEERQAAAPATPEPAVVPSAPTLSPHGVRSTNGTGAPAGAKPNITDASRDAGQRLRILGSGFRAGAHATVNGERRHLRWSSPTEVFLQLESNDEHALSNAGDFLITIVNADGTASDPAEAVEILT